MLSRNTLTIAAVVGLTALVLTGCATANGPSSSSTSASADALVVYNAQHEQLTQEWVDEFTKETGIKVVLRNGDDSELANQLVQEGGASKADVFLTENSPAMSLVENAGLFAPVDPATLALVPEQYRPASGMWTGIAARSAVFVYNPSMLDESQLPASVMDLQSPTWKGRWGGAPGGADFQAIVSAILEEKGSDAAAQWLKGMKQNAQIYQNNVATMKAVNAGQIAGGVIYHYYWFRDQAANKENSGNTKLHYFGKQDPGAFLSISGGGVLASSSRAAEAQRFLAFVASGPGQNILGQGYSFEYPVGSDTPARVPLPGLDSLDAPRIDPSTLNGPQVIDLMTQAGLL